MGVDKGHRTLRKNQKIHRRIGLLGWFVAQDLIDIVEVQPVATKCAADH